MKGFLFTLITFAMLISLFLAFENLSISAFSEAQAHSLSSDSLSYIFDDISDSLLDILQMNASSGDVVYFNGTMPSENLSSKLDAYEEFIRSYYISPYDLSFFSRFNNPIQLKDIDASITILPLNILYQYSSLQKKRVYIYVPQDNLSAINQTDINISLISHSLNASGTHWISVYDCTPSTVHCMHTTIYIADGVNSWSDTRDLDIDRRSFLFIDATTANVRLSIGTPTSNKRIVDLRSNVVVLTHSFGLHLNTSSIRLVMGNKMRVVDTYLNVSRMDYLLVEGN